MVDLTGGNGFSRRKFLGTITGAAALALIGLERKAYADSAPSEHLVADYVGRLCYNENPLGPSPAAIDAIREQAELAHRYPDWFAESLMSALAARYNISSSNVICGSGGTEMLRLCAMSFTQPGKNVVVPNPSYSQFPSDAQLFGASVQNVNLNRNYVVDLEAMRSRVNSNTTAVCITNPNNPTGTIVDPAQLEDFVDDLPSGVVTIIDEAYLEYISDRQYPSAIEMVRSGKNVVVVKTFSKVHGLAGARIGFAVGREASISSMRTRQYIATVSRPSLAAALAALGEDYHVFRTVELASAVKDYCFQRFHGMGLEYIPSEASFFMVNVRRDADNIRAQLANLGYYVRTGWGMPNYLRVSSGTMEEMKGFVAALLQILLTGSNRLEVGSARFTELFQAAPNPFNSSTNIRIFLPTMRATRLEVFDIQGRLVSKLVDSLLRAGEYSFTWNGTDERGHSVASGTYFYRLIAGDDAITRRMMLIK